MRIKAAVLRRYETPLHIEQLELDEPREGEILVRLVAAGVSHRDLEAIAGRSGMLLPFVPGSEAAGVVERVGAGVSAPEPGEPVLIGWSACGSCPRCRAGDERRCERFAAVNLSGRREDGSVPFQADDSGADGGSDVLGFFYGQSSFATHLIVKATAAMAVGLQVPLEVAVALPGEYLTGAAPILRLPTVDPGVPIVVVGAGLVGLAACMAAKARGSDTIIVADADEDRRKLALEVGATIAVPAFDGLASVVRSMAAGGASFALETSGTTAGRHACFASLRPGGTCAIVHASSTLAEIASSDAVEAIIVSADDDIAMATLVQRLLALHAEGALPIEKLINFFPFDQVNDALAAAASGAVLKPVLRFPLGYFGDVDRARREGAATDEASGVAASEPGAGDVATEIAPATEVSA